MSVSLFSFTITVEVGFRTFIVGIYDSLLLILARHVNGLLLWWGGPVGDVVNRAR